MNGAVSLWQEAKTTEGRVYYYNVQTKETQWTKPDTQGALANQPWKEYTAEGGRKYYHNASTGETSWDMPEVFRQAFQKEATHTAPTAAVPTFVAGAGFSQYDYARDRSESSPLGEARQIAYGNDSNGSRAQAFVPANTDPDYSTFQEAEAAFLKLLKRHNVKPEWTWEETMRSIIKDPQYRALKDPKDRKAAFEKYAVDVRLQEKDRAKERLEKLRTDFATMLRSHPEIKHYSRWKMVRPIIEGETIFRSAKDDDERRRLFDDYIMELKKTNVEQETKMRVSAMDELVDILKSMNLEPYTRWAEARKIIESNQRFQGDRKFKSLSKSDVLTAFENHIKSAEKTFNDARQQQKNKKSRKERQNRDRFVELLQELKAGNKVKAGSTWSQVYPLLTSDERYTAILGQPGSGPLDLFRDMVEEEERALRSTRNDVLDVFDDKRFEIQQKTTIEEFLALMLNDRRTANIDRDALQLIFERLHEKITKRSQDDKHQIERQQRRAVDGLRSLIKHLEPPVRIDDTYEKVRPRFEKSEEYNLVPSEDLRRCAFDKVIRRLQEKEEDTEKERLKRRDKTSPVHRTRERSDRLRHLSGRHPRSSRSPERDAYEADRRKAISEREKNYRKATAAESLLSPAHRVDRLERSHYDRERRDREDEREKLYRRRGDPRGSSDELPYGDDRSSGSRRRRADSDVESVGSRREFKRSRREGTPKRERTPPPRERRHKTRTPPVPAKEEPTVHSGSEEGEIEED